MSLRDHYIADEDEISDRLSFMAGKSMLDRSLGKLYRKSDGSAGKSLCGRKREMIILMDTSSLMLMPASEIFLRRIAPAMSKRGQSIIIPISVMGELKTISQSRRDNESRLNAVRILDSVMRCWRRGTVSIYDNYGSDEIFSDEIFQVLAIALARHYRVIVISQDYLLGQDLLTICRLPSVRGREVLVRKLDSCGNIEKISWDGASYLEGKDPVTHRHRQ